MTIHFRLRHLEAFAAIAKAGSLGKAAEQLHTSQPALSRTIRSLETEVGEPLFERHTRGMQLTQAGVSLLPHANAIVNEESLAAEELLALRGMARGTVRVGAIANVASGVLPLAIRELLRERPRLRIEVVEDGWDKLSHLLQTFQLDLALAASVDPLDAGLAAVRNFGWKEETGVVAASDHPLQGRRVRLSDLAGQQWVLLPRGTPPHRAFVAAWTAQRLDPPEVAVETRSVNLIKALVRNCGFLTWMPRSVYRLEAERDLMGPLRISGVSHEFSILAYSRSTGTLPKPVQELLRHLRAVVS
jgi:DNA-binding transcriptional LysR family regulator